MMGPRMRGQRMKVVWSEPPLISVRSVWFFSPGSKKSLVLVSAPFGRSVSLGSVHPVPVRETVLAAER